jgi:hypothetical protein
MRTERSRHILQRGEFFSLLHDVESWIDLQAGIQQIAQLFGKTNDLGARKPDLGLYGSPFNDWLSFTIRPIFLLNLNRLQPIDVELSEYFRPALRRQFSADTLSSSVYCLEDE